MADLHRKRRGCHWASSLTWDATLSANLNLHGASPWHPKQHRQLVSNNQRETPPDKPGASSSSPLRVSTALGFCSDRSGVALRESDPALPRSSENCCWMPRENCCW